MKYSENKLKLIPNLSTVSFPGIQTKILLGGSLGESIKNDFKKGQKFALTVASKQNTESNKFGPNDYYDIGVKFKIENIQPTDKGLLVEIKTEDRVKIKDIEITKDSILASYKVIKEINDLDEKNHDELVKYIKKLVHEIGDKFKTASGYIKIIDEMISINELMGFILPVLGINTKEKQDLLEIDSMREKGIRFIEILNREKENINLQIEMTQKYTESTNKKYREAMLREQLKAIQQELNQGKNHEEKEDNYSTKIDNSEMPDDVKKIARSELKKFETQSQESMEKNIIRNYLDTLIALPWKSRKKEIEIESARKVLNSRHHGMKDVKERVLQHLAVMKLKEEKQGSILLLVGPPGTGKTSLGKSIAEALGRKYLRMSLGGIRDEAEIRGHRRTYVGALPGRIIQGMKKAGEKNPVFVLDEIDKISFSYMGDPASALLEVLDPEQNCSFSDHYLEVPYDLSDVLFIATANSINTIPPALLDRAEVIQISSYTNPEKLVIARDHLMPLVLEEHGLDETKLQIEEKILKSIIEKYTREAGVRGLKKQIAKIARVASEKIVSKKTKIPFVVKENMLLDILGCKTVRIDEVNKKPNPGVVTGLAWTEFGGEILFVESSFMPGTGKLILTGQLGEVMKESGTISLSLIRSRLAHLINGFKFNETDIHVHVPSGATPKDGPSAGITIFTTLASLFTNKIVDPKLAMTGEITLSGLVLPIGGLKEKALAAHRAGIKKIIIPKENAKDLTDVPDEVKEQLEFILVEKVEEVLEHTLAIDLPQPQFLLMQREEVVQNPGAINN